MLLAYPGLYKETMEHILPKMESTLVKEIAVEMVRMELKHAWMVHPSSRELSSALLSRVVQDGILAHIDDIDLLKRLFLKR